MDRCSKALTLFVIMLGLFTLAGAEVKVADHINIDAEFRPRLELDGRDFDSDTGYDSYATYRTRLGVRFRDLIENTQLYVMIGDSRTMGYADPYLTGSPVGPNRFDNNLGVIKAYIEVQDIITPGLFLKVGRMSNDQGRYRLFGPGNWNVYGPRTYDGIKVGYGYETFSLNLWTLFGVNGDRHWYPLPEDPPKYPNPDVDFKRDHTLTGLDLSLLNGSISLLSYLDLDQAPVADTLHDESHVAVSRMTTALYANHTWGRRSQHRIDLDLAYQFGTMGHSTGQADISAYLLAGDWAWRLEDRLDAWVSIGFHILSGDNGEDPEKVYYFYDRYCSKHRVLGHMDYFTSDTGIKSLGIRDFIFRTGVSPIKELKGQLDLHHFYVEKPFPSAVDGSDANNLGQELDATIKYTLRKGLHCVLGMDFFLPSEDWQGSGADVATLYYLYLSATL